MTGEEFAKATIAKNRGELTPVAIESLKRYASQHNLTAEQAITLMSQVQYDNLMGCWFFVRNGMYHGIEKDGYIHT